MDGQYHVVFDLAASGYKAWTSLVPGVVVFLVGLLMAIFPGIIPQPWPWSRSGVRVFGWLIVIFAGALSGVAFWSTYSEYRELASRLSTGRYEIVEGTVENYRQDRTDEAFTVGNVPFEYSDFSVSSAFNNTAAQGGPIRPSLAVRIAHTDGKILRLEIRR